jgi:hypothetical protein
MARKYFDRLFYRAAGTPAASLVYANDAISGWTKCVGSLAGVKAAGLDADGKDELGDGTELVTSEKVAPEITLKNFTAANAATIRSAFLNVLVDVVVLDSQQISPAYAAWATRLYPKNDIGNDAEPTIVLSGQRKAGAAITNTPFTYVTVTIT